MRFRVQLTPRAAADEVAGVVQGTLAVRVTAPPVDDAANVSLVRFLARELGVAPSRIQIVTGAYGRLKTLAVDGVPRQALVERWPGLDLTESG